MLHWKIDGFNGLPTLFERLDKSGRSEYSGILFPRTRIVTSHFREMLKRPFWRKKTEQVAVKINTKKQRQIALEIVRAAPSCNDSAATIVIEQFTRTRKGVGTTCPAFLKEY